MRVADRDIRRIVAAPVGWRHWRALLGVLTTVTSPVETLRRYLTNRGSYPWMLTLRTPVGPVRLTLADRHDLLTVNEVFCRRDYGAGPRRTIVDIGANVGIATLFFLTRSPATRVWAFEPDPANVARLRENLSGFENRYTLVAAAVTPDDPGSVAFVPAGRYGHVAAEGSLVVPAVSVAEALRRVADSAGPIDLVKIDTEGTETELAGAIPVDLPVREVRYEDNRGRVVAVRRYATATAARSPSTRSRIRSWKRPTSKPSA